MQAYFIFQKTMTDLDEERRIYGELKAAVDFVIGSAEAHGSVAINEDLQRKVRGLDIRFYGDLVLPRSPSTYEEAMEVYAELPSYVVGENAHSVPMRVHLAPLSSLDPDGTFSLVRDISKSMISDVIDILQELEDAEEEAHYLSQSTAGNYFSFIATKIDRFQNLLRQYQQSFQGHIGPLIVGIRGSGREEGELASYLQQHFNSPFSKFSMQTWVEQVKEECSVLESFINLLSHVTFCKNNGEFIHQVLTNDRVISLNMYFPEITDTVLESMDNFLDGHDFSNSVNSNLWFRQWTTAFNFERHINYLNSYREANSQDSSIAFVYQALLPPNSTVQSPYTEIQGIYKEYGFAHEEVFIPPSQPTSVLERIQDNSTTLTWEPPTLGSGFLEHYNVVVRPRGNFDPDETIEYRFQTESTTTEFQITALDSNIPYDVYVYGVGRIGRTASSETLHHSGVQVQIGRGS